jgi:hypothetical protein
VRGVLPDGSRRRLVVRPREIRRQAGNVPEQRHERRV